VVRRWPGISVAEAAAELGVAPNTVSTLVRQLVEAGVVERRVGQSDRRVAELFLQEAVAQGLGDWAGKRSDTMAAALDNLSEEDHQALASSVGPLARLAAAVGDKRGRA